MMNSMNLRGYEQIEDSKWRRLSDDGLGDRLDVLRFYAPTDEEICDMIKGCVRISRVPKFFEGDEKIYEDIRKMVRDLPPCALKELRDGEDKTLKHLLSHVNRPESQIQGQSYFAFAFYNSDEARNRAKSKLGDEENRWSHRQKQVVMRIDSRGIPCWESAKILSDYGVMASKDLNYSGDPKMYNLAINNTLALSEFFSDRPSVERVRDISAKNAGIIVVEAIRETVNCIAAHQLEGLISSARISIPTPEPETPEKGSRMDELRRVFGIGKIRHPRA